MAGMITFGSFAPVPIAGCTHPEMLKVAKPRVAKQVLTTRLGTNLSANRSAGRALIKAYDEQQARFEEQLAHMGVRSVQQKTPKVCKTFDGFDSVVTHIVIPSTTRVENDKSLQVKHPAVVYRKRKTPPRQNYVTLDERGLSDLFTELSQYILLDRQVMQILQAGKRKPITISRCNVGPYTTLHVTTKHELGKMAPIDLSLDEDSESILQSFANTLPTTLDIREEDFRPGTSGAIIRRDCLDNVAHKVPDSDYFIVRGRFAGSLLDARETFNISHRFYLRQYSVADQFWKGFDTEFRQQRGRRTIHEGMNTLSVEATGSVAAIACQALYPCCRITCTECGRIYDRMSETQLSDHVQAGLRAGIETLRNRFPEFHHVQDILERYSTSFNNSGNNSEAHGRIKFSIGDINEPPFTYIHQISNTIFKGGRASKVEFETAMNLLLETTRWLRNRHDRIAKDPLSAFRNKVSGKALLNPTLMCDNQRDVNGNFIWGKRGYHAKRFFSNYFSVIEPQHGYDAYVTRTFPNGTRKLAIGSLILSTNLDELKAQLEGESIHKEPLSIKCTSEKNNSYVYPCCCVTNDVGVPIYSGLKTPTRNHIVVGNTGEAKYLDLPVEISEKLYIAKEGYCYINIFLAMLVNVDEKDAKTFTKWVRDVIATQLKTWPTMHDVALACYQLSILFPSVRSAELPRILVDHHTTTMHVIDSYGSYTTGYHILKANTVEQLIEFASDALKSEMKHYRVGGDMTNNLMLHSSLRTLIKSIYRPELMHSILMDEPYLITLSILSPSVVIEMCKSGCLFEAFKHIKTKEMPLRMIINILHGLAARISRAESYVEQVAIIDGELAQFQHVLTNADRCNISRCLAYRYIQTRMSLAVVNQRLEANGYYEGQMVSNQFVEKIYQDELAMCWDELPLSSKLSATIVRYKWRAYIENFSKTIDKGTLSTPCKLYMKPLYMAKEKFKQAAQRGRNRMSTYREMFKQRYFMQSFSMLRYIAPELSTLVRTITIFSTLIGMLNAAKMVVVQIQQHKGRMAQQKEEEQFAALEKLYHIYCGKIGDQPTYEEFYEFVKGTNSSLLCILESFSSEFVGHQDFKSENKRIEQILAFVVLIMMLIDAERSDCVYKILNKFKGVIRSIEPVGHQSLDDIAPDFEFNETIEFSLDTEGLPEPLHKLTTFSGWWNAQLIANRTTSHYRTEGHFLEFTRATCASVANQIITSEHTNFLIRGAVGSGKSTGLPNMLARDGRVLLLESTRPLAENVFTQLQCSPFHLNPTLMMRDVSSFGASPITVMTSGFALHYFANNYNKLQDFKYIIIDECHVQDATAIAFNNLLVARSFEGKLLKVSATPPGRETEFTTEHPVALRTRDSLTFKQFVDELGTGSNVDVTKVANNILVYVASYNEVDALAKLLVEAKFLVTKVDGRTMKNGSTNIETKGTEALKHFIVATNIIENGVTLDIEAVVDFGQKVQPYLDMDLRRVMYSKVGISYGERIQRLGRVGRTKSGTALRIGHSEKNLTPIPEMIATEAAFYCFIYGLPVTTAQVNTTMLSECTVPQARTMHLFELPLYFMMNLVHYDGTMHPAVYAQVKKYRLRESEVILNKRAIPHASVSSWISVKEYSQCGVVLALEPNVKLPFFVKDIPDKLYSSLWEVVVKHKSDAGFKPLKSSNAAKIAYVLKTDPLSITRTCAHIDELIRIEMQKKATFDSLANYSVSHSFFSLESITRAIRSRYASNYSVENITILQSAKAQLIEFSQTYSTGNGDFGMHIKALEHQISSYGAFDAVRHQSVDGVASALELKGQWNTTLITNDILIGLATVTGEARMLYEYVREGLIQPVQHQGFNRRQRQKLKFRSHRDSKIGRIVDDVGDGSVEYHFGEAYAKKAKGKGKKIGMGVKTRRFMNMYGFDPVDYSFIRFVDPITGAQLDQGVLADIGLVQEHFDEIRTKHVEEDIVSIERINYSPGIQAYFVKDKTTPVLKVDLTQHAPLKICDTGNIAGFPERENELRQTGQGILIRYDEIPKPVEENVGHEAYANIKGLRDYNPIAKSVCQLTNKSDGVDTRMYGIGFGPYIITNRHLFVRNNGTLILQTTHGEFTCKNTTQLNILPVEDRDIIIVRMPKDFPPFPMTLKFRSPRRDDQICLVGTNFQEKYMSSMVTSQSHIAAVSGTQFWRHWIETKHGHCGLPAICSSDMHIIGLHSLSSNTDASNFITTFPPNFNEILRTCDNGCWSQKWRYNPNEISWGSLELQKNVPQSPFSISKIITDLFHEPVECQAEVARREHDDWLYGSIKGNIQAVGKSTSHLVTKHVVKGRAELFQLYLSLNATAESFFKPRMGFYQKSRLNRQAYIKDIMKYSTTIPIGDVQTDIFETAVSLVVDTLKEFGMDTCTYITDEDEIFDSLNMKAAMGALYTGKKREALADISQQAKEDYIAASCHRLYKGQMGVWNGSIKAELRPLEKTLANKTRTFTAAPLDTLLSGKVCVDDFNNQFYAMNTKAPWSVGISKFHLGWNNMLKQLPKGWVHCDADGSRFDSTLTPYLLNAVLQIRLRFMEDWALGAQMLSNLYTEIIYTPILLADGTIVKKFKGNNSGQPSTVVDNTLMVLISVRYALLRAGIDPEKHKDICKYFANGDDLLISLHPDFEWILDTMSESFAELGLSYDFTSRHRDVCDLWFMSHKGILLDGAYIPKLEEQRIVSILEWTRASEPAHRLEAICAAMIEAWGYPELLHQIRLFYYWVLQQEPYHTLATEGKAPYISECALRKLYTDQDISEEKNLTYLESILASYIDDSHVSVYHQSGSSVDAGVLGQSKGTAGQSGSGSQAQMRDKDVNVGTHGTFAVPRLRHLTSKLSVPKLKGESVVNLEHLLHYQPNQDRISNTRATDSQFQLWYDGVKSDYDVNDEEMKIILNGLMVWCIENGTSPNINGFWVMLENDEQIEFPIKPLIDHARPTFRQIMSRFSDLAEAYIEKRNFERAYMPRYGLQRNLTDMSLARYAFDFYEMTSKAPARAREAHIQMKAAALRNTKNRMFGLDGKVGTQEEDTERHTSDDVTGGIHSLHGVRGL
ncbi:polyprotein [Gloriosa stripe mosaic virus]|uniref:Genome polyprotein n=1 Tax=Gloriosa stripe mosaic virus TaxID=12201 RepID=D3THK6_GSMV|nr:polyprotein [Gloriosa stripe mosaic virus]ABR88099.1 polyprotein [Gloriosa stripe mosaic virus]